MARWLKADIGKESVSMDEIINDDMLCHTNSPKIIKLLLTGYADEAMKLVIETYEQLADDYIDEAIEAHFWRG